MQISNTAGHFPDQRSAGILLHLTSLPGPAYIGDIGPAAALFAEFLHRCNQSVWQMLPVQPTDVSQGHSPYSSPSAMAGNLLLISPEILLRDGLVNRKEVKKGDARDTQVNFEKASRYKEELLQKAWSRWKQQHSEAEEIAFIEYCNKQAYWLNDYALYSLFKAKYKNAPWYQWPDEYKNRHAGQLEKVQEENAEELDRIKWMQMLFDRQWKALRSYCETMQVQLLGDVPIYVSHDSADVWSHRELFTVDDEGALTEVSGVPPDLFNSEGQLWGMPLFRWNELKKTKYDWWLKRVRRNLEWFDVLRLDHFRGFSSYWSVPADAKSAREGRWIEGPGLHFFEQLSEDLGSLPFVAEDLGEIDKPVYQLRDDLKLPGMNVLQFGFGDGMPTSNYLPHHHTSHSVVYTGTHDNNTTRGWFKDASDEERKNLSGYLGSKLTESNVTEHFVRLAYMSVSKLCIIPMQDVLSLDATARMNMPATPTGNWKWRMRGSLVTKQVESKLNEWCFYYDRMRKP